jgi:hypothetical protein
MNFIDTLKREYSNIIDGYMQLALISSFSIPDNDDDQYAQKEEYRTSIHLIDEFEDLVEEFINNKKTDPDEFFKMLEEMAGSQKFFVELAKKLLLKEQE